MEKQEELDLTDIGPNPTPQMIELKKKKMVAQKSPAKPRKSGLVTKVTNKALVPPKPQFTGNKNNAIYLVVADVLDKFQGALELSKLVKLAINI